MCDSRCTDFKISKCVVVGILMCRMRGGKKNIKWAMILLSIGALAFCYWKG